jgi:AraC-like DNA-binding protein
LNPQFSLFDLLILIGILQGLITGILLLITKKNPRSNLFLGLGLIAFSFLISKTLLHTLELWNTQIFRYFPNGTELVIAPLIYFYIRSLIDSKFKFKRKDLLHFIPFVLSQAFSFIVYISVISVEEFSQKDIIAESMYFNSVKQIEEYLVIISIVYYLYAGYSNLKSYRKWLNNTTSDSTFPEFSWLRSIYIFSAIVATFSFINISLDFFFNLRDVSNTHWQAYQIFISFFIYYLGFIGYKQPHFDLVEIDTILEDSKETVINSQKDNEIGKALNKALEVDRIFLNPTINLQQVSNLLGVNQRNLSHVINNSFHKTFRDLINDYRISEVKLKLIDKEFEHMSILGIALECGFNSEASFYRIFKKNTGLSPKEFIKRKNHS